MYKDTNIIKKLYHGELQPKKEENHLKEYETIKNESIDIAKKILENLDSETTDMFFKYIHLQSQRMNIDAEEQFTKGFKMATGLIIEGMSK